MRRVPPLSQPPSSPPPPQGHHLQLFNGLLQAEQLLPNFLGLYWAWGAAPWDSIAFERRPHPAVFLRGKQELLQGQHWTGARGQSQRQGSGWDGWEVRGGKEARGLRVGVSFRLARPAEGAGGCKRGCRGEAGARVGAGRRAPRTEMGPGRG